MGELPDGEAFDAFLEEAQEHINTLEQHLLAMEGQGAEPESDTVNRVFRAAHTIKGTAGFFGLTAITKVAHAMENVLGQIRAHELRSSPRIASILIEGGDALAVMLRDIHNMDKLDNGALLDLLHQVETQGNAFGADAPAHEAPAPTEEASTPPTETAPEAAPPEPPPPMELEAMPEPAAAPQEQFSDEQEAPEPVVATARSGRSEGASTIRVNLAQLDRLMNLAGEMVLTRNSLLKKAQERDLEQMIALTQRVDAITSELQDGIMATRMQPVGTIFSKFKRIVRDLSRTLDKEIDLTIEGEEVELDKTILEAMSDPLTHLVRNAADHGIEEPGRRVALGKSQAGRLKLKAYHQAGQVLIEVSDDGAGIDPDRVARKALEVGLRTAEQLRMMSREEKLRLIFAAGFSTAQKVTEVSGRGVGMDVVHAGFTKVGGTVDLASDVGKGTTVTVRLPLTLAIIPAVLVGVADQRFAIPQVNLVELVRVPPAEVQKRVERVGSAMVMRLRGELLPLVRLSDVLGTPVAFKNPATGQLEPERRAVGIDRRSVDLLSDGTPNPAAERRTGKERRAPNAAVNVVVLSAGNLRYGLIVSQFLDSEEIVVKPLGAHLAHCQTYAGTTIRGDGTVALILDVMGIAAVANLSSTKALIENVESRQASKQLDHDAQTYMVVENAPGELFGVPLGLVSRIERIRRENVVRAGGRTTITQGNRMVAMLAIEDVAKVGPRPDAPAFFAIICKANGREFGVMVSRIVDVQDGTAPIDAATHLQPGILGSTIIGDQLLLLLDVHGLVDTLLPEYKRIKPPQEESHGQAVLVVEDSPFFRKQIVSCLTEAGVETISAEDGEAGLLALEQNASKVGLIITDIEMPRMDGLEMTRRIRQDARMQDMPILACTTLSGDVAERRGREAGLTEYLIKLDRELILERTNHHLKSQRAGVAVRTGA